MQEPSKFCPRCSAQNHEGAACCHQCGSQFSQPPATRAQRNSVATFLIRFTAVILGAFAVIWIVAVIQDSKRASRASLENSPAPTSSTSRPLWSPTPDPLPASEALTRAKALLAKPYDKYGYEAAFDLLSRIPADAKEYKESIPLKQKVTRVRERESVAEEAAARKAGADNVERGLLSQGYDATVTVSGSQNRTIRVTYVLMNRPMVYQLVERGILDQLRSQGFRKVIFSDGYGRTWWYNL